MTIGIAHLSPALSVLFRGTVEWGIGLRTAKALLAQASKWSTSPFFDFRLGRGVTWLEPTLHVEVTYSEIMQGGSATRCIAGSPDTPARPQIYLDLGIGL